MTATAQQALLTGDLSANIGLVDAVEQKDASHLFTLSNATHSAITLSAIRGSCGCEALAFVVDGKSVQNTVLQAGQTVQASMNVRLRGQPNTELTKTAWVIGADGKILATLNLSFQVRQPFLLQPSHVDLGDIPTGGTKTAVVNVEIDSALAPDNQFPTFSSDTPGVTATLNGPISRSVRDGKPTLIANYLVTAGRLTGIGPVAAMLTTSLTTPAGPVGNIFLPVDGDVVGTIAANPTQLNFGAIAAGADTVRTVVVTGASQNDLSRIKLSSGSPWLVAELIPVSQPGVTACTVTITLSGKAPAGPISTFLTMTAGPNQNLTIPIKANIVE